MVEGGTSENGLGDSALPAATCLYIQGSHGIQHRWSLWDMVASWMDSSDRERDQRCYTEISHRAYRSILGGGNNPDHRHTSGSKKKKQLLMGSMTTEGMHMVGHSPTQAGKEHCMMRSEGRHIEEQMR